MCQCFQQSIIWMDTRLHKRWSAFCCCCCCFFFLFSFSSIPYCFKFWKWILSNRLIFFWCWVSGQLSYFTLGEPDFVSYCTCSSLNLCLRCFNRDKITAGTGCRNLHWSSCRYAREIIFSRMENHFTFGEQCWRNKSALKKPNGIREQKM